MNWLVKEEPARYSFHDLVPVKELKFQVMFAAIKAEKSFATFPLVRISRLSVMTVTDEEWKRIEALGA